jgi:uncharacterized membrane protein YeaQ/YmgE (transglycosylase-associated protein family)
MKKNLGYFGLGILTIGVLLFLGKHSLNFFTFTFGAEDQLYAWMGLLLTSIGAIIWLWIFKFTDGTRLQKTVALVMMFVALLGEFLTAGLDIYMQAMIKDGFNFAPNEIRMFSIIVSAFGLATGLALVIHFAGDSIIEEFKKDKDGDGIPDFVDPVDNRQIRQTTRPMLTNASEVEQVHIVGSNNHKAVADPQNRRS